MIQYQHSEHQPHLLEQLRRPSTWLRKHHLPEWHTIHQVVDQKNNLRS
ncbi:hypothetical protein [Escherichia phage PH1062]|nr:hypothetical protein [Escherichia phage PH1062]